MGWETERRVKYRAGREIVKKCVYLGRDIYKKGRVEVEVRCRIQAGANAWIYLDGNGG